jgi:hypothetical protein
MLIAKAFETKGKDIHYDQKIKRVDNEADNECKNLPKAMEMDSNLY